jgi:hypothetical protein
MRGTADGIRHTPGAGPKPAVNGQAKPVTSNQ